MKVLVLTGAESAGKSCQPEVAQRWGFHEACRTWLERRELPFVEIAGDWASREALVISQVRALLRQ